MIIFALILAVIVGNLCVSSNAILGFSSNINLFYAACVALFVVCRIYYFKQKRVSIQTVAFSSRIFKYFLIAVAFVLCVFGMLNFQENYKASSDIFSTLSCFGMLASGFATLVIALLAGKHRIRNQLAAMVGTVPILWLIYELILIFKGSLSNPHIEQYVFAVLTYIATSIAFYYFTSAFCVTDKTNLFKEFYMLSIFVNVVYLVATSKGFVSSDIISTKMIIGSCLTINIFMLPYYITQKDFIEKVIFKKQV